MQAQNVIPSLNLKQVFLLSSNKNAEQRKEIENFPLFRLVLNLRAIIKENLLTNSIEECYNYVKQDIENYLFYIIQNPPPANFFQDVATEFLQTAYPDQQINLHTYIELTQEIADAKMEVVREAYRNKILPLETFETLLHLHPNANNLIYILSRAEAIIAFNFGFLVSCFFNIGALNLHETNRKELITFLDKATIHYGAYSIILGFWQPEMTTSNAMIGEIENLVVSIKAEHKEILPYTPTILHIFDKTYYFNFPLPCIVEKEDDYYMVRNERLDIVGTGMSVQAAKESFALEFDYIYTRYNELSENKLSERLRTIKKAINSLVKIVL